MADSQVKDSKVADNQVADKTWRDLFAEGLSQASDLSTDPAARTADPTPDPAASALKHLLSSASGMSPTELALSWDEPAHPKDIAAFERMLHSWLAGKPLQYVLGSWGFRSLDLYLDERVLIPRPETETLVEIANQELARQRAPRSPDHEPSTPQSLSRSPDQKLPAPQRLRVADLGCGSGAIGLSLAAENTDTEIFCCDISHDALAVTRANLAGLGMAASPVYMAQGSWYQGLAQAVRLAGEGSGLAGESPGEASFAVICSNPPYVANCEKLPKNVAEHEPHEALYAGETGTEAIAELLAGAADWLVAGGAFVCEIAPSQADFAGQLALDCGLVDVELTRDLAGRTRILRARKAGSPMSELPALKSEPAR